MLSKIKIHLIAFAKWLRFSVLIFAFDLIDGILFNVPLYVYEVSEISDSWVSIFLITLLVPLFSINCPSFFYLLEKLNSSKDIANFEFLPFGLDVDVICSSTTKSLILSSYSSFSLYFFSLKINFLCFFPPSWCFLLWVKR